MKILAIRGRNLASLAGDFTVDFEQEPLKSAGLFAICGPTGAGKSTLLDALCMALYEKTPRLHKAGGIGLPDVGDSTVTQQDARNLLRRGTAEGHAEVDFIGHDGIGYRARWSVRRARGKADGSLQKTGMSLKQLPALQPIGGTNKEVLAEIVQRIGLSFDQFTRAVLLAQNEFSAFLKADDNERGELLETLTGSAIYSVLSQRAYARAKHEQQELQRLADRLADQKPLADDVRLQLQQDSAAADATVAAFDRRQAVLEAQWRWHQDQRKFCESEQLAAAQLQQQQAAQSAAAERRAALQQVESVQAARPLVAEAERLARALAADHDAIAECRLKLAGTEQARQQADAALEAAQRALQEAEQARANAAPALDQAKALDARIDTLLPAQQQAQQAHAAALQAAAQAEHKRQAKEAELAGAQQQLQATEAWLAHHAAWQTLAESWPRWDILLKQACVSWNEIARINDILATISKNEARQTALVNTTATAQAAAAAALAAAGSQRQHAAQQHADIDLAALQSRKQSAERRREYLSSAEQCWRTLAELQTRQQTLAAQIEHSRQAAAQATAALAQIDSQLPALAAALAQAERSLKGAEAACAESVEKLRATLQADMPCPVCGATAHPYTTDNPQLHAMLASLQAQVQDCRLQQQQAQQQQATHHAEAASQRRQLEAWAQEQQQLDAAILRQHHEWQAQRASAEPIAEGANPLAVALPAEFDSLDPARQAGWFASASASVQAQLHEIGQIEDAWRRAALAKDAAQAAFDRATLEHDASKEAAGAAQAALAETRAQQRATTEQLAQYRHRLDDSLQQLDAAFTVADTGAAEAAPHSSEQAGQSEQVRQAGWRAHWQAAPETFHAECARQAAQWQSQRHAFEQGRQRHASLTLELAGLVETHAKAGIE
jgi:exonuclease SbcC